MTISFVSTKFCGDIVPVSIVRKFDEDWIRFVKIRWWTNLFFLKKKNQRAVRSIWLFIELSQDIVPISIVYSFDKNG